MQTRHYCDHIYQILEHKPPGRVHVVYTTHRTKSYLRSKMIL